MSIGAREISAQFSCCSDIRRSVRYVGIDVDDAIEIAEKIDILCSDAVTLCPHVIGGANCVADHKPFSFRRLAVDCAA